MLIKIRGKDDILERTCDSRGRVTLGSGYADKDVVIGVIETGEKE